MTKKRDIRIRNAGHVLIELLIVSPVLLMIPAGVLEYTRFMRYDQMAVSFGQEAANEAYRQCGDIQEVRQTATDVAFDEAASIAGTKQCLNSVIQRIQPRLDARIPGGMTKIVLGVYRYKFDQTNDTLQSVAIWPTPDANNEFTKTRVAVSGKTLVNNVNNKVLVAADQATDRERIVVAEVTFGYQPVFGLFNAVLSANWNYGNGGYRETTIL